MNHMNVQWYNKSSIWLGVFLIVLFYALNASADISKPPLAKKGRLDLREWSFKEKGNIRLDGEWEFYPGVLLMPEDFIKKQIKKTPVYFPVPGLWNGHTADGAPLPAHGYATYRLMIRLNAVGKILGLQQKRMGTAYRLWVNDTLVISNGKVGPSADTMIPQFLPCIGLFFCQADQIQIVLQVSNFYHKKGGVWNPVKLGLSNQIEKSRERTLGFDLFLFGSILIMAFYHFVLFILNRKEKSTLYFGIFCTLVCIRIMVTGQAFLINWFPGVSWEIANKLEYISYYLLVPVFVVFIGSLFRKTIPPRLARIAVWIGWTATLFVLATPGRIFTYSLIYYQAYSLVIMVLSFIYVTLRLKTRNKELMIFYLGLVAPLLSGVNDILYHNQLIFTGDLFPLGLFVFIFCQSILLSIRFSQSFAWAEREKREKIVAVKANQAKSKFLANMSHELRTPLNAVIGFAQIMTQSRTLPAKHQENAKIIQSSGNHLLTLINQVLDLSKIEAGQMTLNSEMFDLSGMLDEIADMFRLKAGSKGISLSLEKEYKLPKTVLCDETKLRQVLINLIGNAVKFTEKGGVILSIKAKIPKPHKCRLYFTVKDTGPGISEAERENLFKAFSQTEAGLKAREGSGLGLPISRAFVQRMGGDIIVKSKKGEGACFIFDVKADIPEDALVKNSARKEHIIKGPVPGQKTFRVLIVDDEKNNRLLLKNILEKVGCRTREANTGIAAVKTCMEWSPDIVFMDIRMPEMDGYSTTREIRAQAGKSTPVIIALSASVFEDEREKIQNVGFDDFIRKPYRQEQIAKALEDHLGFQFIYESPRKGKASCEEGNIQKDTDWAKERVSGLPSELQSGLQKAVALSDYDQILDLINEIKDHDPELSKTLLEWAVRYRFDWMESACSETDTSQKL
jgi:two-component system sensor histidine kinase ChiS